MATPMTGLGARVRALRTARGWSMRQLAARCAISERFLRDLETGRGNISVIRLARLAEAFGRSAATLLAEAEEAVSKGEALSATDSPPVSRSRVPDR